MVAINTDDISMIEVLLQFETLVLGDALLHAAGVGNCIVLQMLITRFG